MEKNHNQLFVLIKYANISNLASGRDRAHLKIHDRVLKLLVADWEKWKSGRSRHLPMLGSIEVPASTNNTNDVRIAPSEV